MMNDDACGFTLEKCKIILAEYYANYCGSVALYSFKLYVRVKFLIRLSHHFDPLLNIRDNTDRINDETFEKIESIVYSFY